MKYETWEKSSNMASVLMTFNDEQTAGVVLLDGVLDGYSYDI